MNESFDIFDLARREECLSLIKMVLENLDIYDCHINSQDADGNTLLHLIIEHQDNHQLIEHLASYNPDVNLRNNINETPLYLACRKQNLETMKLLLEKDADLHIKDTKLRSLLHIAVEQNNLEICKFLIGQGIDVNSQDYEGATPLHYAVELKLNTITFLLVHKAEIDKIDCDGYTPLHFAAKKSGELVKFLVRNKASIEKKTFNGDLPLHLAASNGNLEAVQVLLNANFQLRCSLNNDNYSPGKLAEINGHQAIQELCDGGTDGPQTRAQGAGNLRKNRTSCAGRF